MSATSTGGGIWISGGVGSAGESSGTLWIGTSDAGSAGVSGGITLSSGEAKQGSSGTIWIGSGSATDERR